MNPELLSEIHSQFRRQMNADVSASLRRHGVVYHLAFGVPSMRLKEVAALYEPSAELAETLWGEDIRESKMLATRLYPLNELKEATALRWASQAPYDEITDQLVMNLLSRAAFAPRLLSSLAAEPDRRARYTALMLATRLRDSSLRSEAQAWVADPSLDIAFRTAASNYLS